MIFRKLKSFRTQVGNFWRICVLVSLYNVVSVTIPLLFCCSITTHTGWSTQHSNDSRSISISFCSQLLFSRFSYFRFRSPHTCLPCYCYGQITNVLEKGTVTAAEAECYFSWAFKEKRRVEAEKFTFLVCCKNVP